MGRPTKAPKEKLIEHPCAVPPEVAEEIEQIAIATDRSRSQIARKLVWRGLIAYRRDGSLDEPTEAVENHLPAPIPAGEILKAIANGDKVRASRLDRSPRKGGRK